MFILPGHGPSFGNLRQRRQARINVDQKNNAETFKSELTAIIEARRDREILPNQLREIWEMIINQFPPALKETGQMSVNELKAWERKLGVRKVGPFRVPQGILLFAAK